MKKIVELPLLEPMYSTYHNQGLCTALLAENPSIRNYCLGESLVLKCNTKFLKGFTTPEINVIASSWGDYFCFDNKWFPMEFLDEYINCLIHSLLDAGYYVYFTDVDDYYIQGKSWYNKRHFSHDGTICGYNLEDDTYCIYAYDSDFIYRKFWTPKIGFDKGRRAMHKKGIYGQICGIKPKPDIIDFLPFRALEVIKEYLNPTVEKYPFIEKGSIFGIEVQDYIAKYIGKLYDGSIPYERMDYRIMRTIWEHKKVMTEVIQKIETALNLDNDMSERYKPLIKTADNIRMLYASYQIKRRDSILPIIQKKLLEIKETEQILLPELIKKTEGITLK